MNIVAVIISNLIKSLMMIEVNKPRDSTMYGAWKGTPKQYRRFFSLSAVFQAVAAGRLEIPRAGQLKLRAVAAPGIGA
ncbi:hypothetical protein JHU04_001154 [Brenneria sp. 4F2]|nr:hypothetical protein [Brenneria bubanii]